MAAAAVAQGWAVDLVSGPVALASPPGVTVHHVVSAADMFAACEPLFPTCDFFIAVAAVADYRPKEVSASKQKKRAGPLTLELIPTIDILKTLAARKRPGQTVVGFAAETNNLETYARQKMAEKKLDWIVANDVSQPGTGMNVDANTVLLLSAKGAKTSYGPAPKDQVARFVLGRIVG